MSAAWCVHIEYNILTTQSLKRVMCPSLPPQLLGLDERGCFCLCQLSLQRRTVEYLWKDNFHSHVIGLVWSSTGRTLVEWISLWVRTIKYFYMFFHMFGLWLLPLHDRPLLLSSEAPNFRVLGIRAFSNSSKLNVVLVFSTFQISTVWFVRRSSLLIDLKVAWK